MKTRLLPFELFHVQQLQLVSRTHTLASSGIHKQQLVHLHFSNLHPSTRPYNQGRMDARKVRWCTKDSRSNI